MTTPSVDDFPIPKEDFLRAAAIFLAHQGARTEVRLLATVGCEISLSDYDGWDGGQYTWRVAFGLPLEVLSQVTDAERNALCDRLHSAMNRVLANFEGHGVGQVSITMEIPTAPPDWRANATRWASGEGLTNQGRARSDNLAPLTEDGLLFRSRPEINLYLAFKALGVAVAPLPVFIRGGEKYRRIEPDFLLVHAGRMMVVEVDGADFHPETPAQAHDRLTMLSHEGVDTERVSAAKCSTPEAAKVCARELLDVLKRMSQIK